MSQEENMGLDTDERALADRLHRLKLPEPPAELDQRIRAHARAAVLQRPRWGWGMGVAATAVLSAVMLQQTMQDTRQQMLPEMAPAVAPSASTPPAVSEQATERAMLPEGGSGTSDAAGRGTTPSESVPGLSPATPPSTDGLSSSASVLRDSEAQPGVSSSQRRSVEAASPSAERAQEESSNTSSSLREAEWTADPPPASPPAPALQGPAKASEPLLRPAPAPVTKPAPEAPSPPAEVKTEAGRKSDAGETRSRAPQVAPAPPPAPPAPMAPPAPAASAPIEAPVSRSAQPTAPKLRLEVGGTRQKRQADPPELEFASFEEGVARVRRLLAEGERDRALQTLRVVRDRYPGQALPDDLDALLGELP